MQSPTANAKLVEVSEETFFRCRKIYPTRISGIFSFDYIWDLQNGASDGHFSFRLVLSPNL